MAQDPLLPLEHPAAVEAGCRLRLRGWLHSCWFWLLWPRPLKLGVLCGLVLTADISIFFWLNELLFKALVSRFPEIKDAKITSYILSLIKKGYSETILGLKEDVYPTIRRSSSTWSNPSLLFRSKKSHTGRYASILYLPEVGNFLFTLCHYVKRNISFDFF